MKRVLLMELRSMIADELEMMREASMQGKRLHRGTEFEYEGKRYRYDGPAKNNVGKDVHRVTDLETQQARTWSKSHFNENVASGKIKIIDHAQNEGRVRRLVLREDSEGGGGSMRLSTALAQLKESITASLQTSNVLQRALGKAPSGGAAENILVEVTLCGTALETALKRVERALSRAGN